MAFWRRQEQTDPVAALLLLVLDDTGLGPQVRDAIALGIMGCGAGLHGTSVYGLGYPCALRNARQQPLWYVRLSDGWLALVLDSLLFR